MACLRPEYIYRVVSHTRDDTSGNFDVQDLSDSMDHFWRVYDEERRAKRIYGGEQDQYEQRMGMFRDQAGRATDIYLDQMQSLDAISSEFIEVCDPGQWHGARKSGTWFAENGTKLLPRAAFARQFKASFLHIFKHMVPYHAIHKT